MEIFSFTSKIKESYLFLNCNTRPGYISRYIILKNESEDVPVHKFYSELKISQLPDHEDLIRNITNGTTVLKGLSTNKNEFSEGTSMLGQARKLTVKKKTDITDYRSGEVFFDQGLFESIEKTLQNNVVYKVIISGLKYKKKT